MEDQKRSFTGVWMPREVLDNPNMSFFQKVLYCDIASFEDCFMSNARLAERYDMSERTITKNISALIEAGFLVQTGFDGRSRHLSARHVSAMKDVKVLGRVEPEFYADPNQSSRIENSIDNTITSEANASHVSVNEDIGEDEYSTAIVDDNGNEINPTFRKKDTSYRVVFNAFAPDYPKSWERNTTQIKSAKALMAERGMEQVQKALDFYRKNCHRQFIPEISTPYDLDTKWEKLLAFKDKAH
jgi:DNA-binding Lrp family transcriptional regulator